MGVGAICWWTLITRWVPWACDVYSRGHGDLGQVNGQRSDELVAVGDN
jgi:hypothetical protein